jgi:hypothetical protein
MATPAFLSTSRGSGPHLPALRVDPMTRNPINLAGNEPDSLRWLIATAAFILAMLIIVGILSVLAWSAILGGDRWGAWSYGGLAVLVIILALRRL